MRFLSALLLAAPVLASVPIPYTNCGQASDILTIHNATSNVWPPVKGQEFDVSFNGELSKDINGGTYHAKLSFDFIPILDKSGSFSDLNVTFPIKGGPVVINQGLTFPAQIPSGYVDLTVSAQDEKGTEIACIELKLQLAQTKPTKSIKPPIHIIDYLPGLANANVAYTNCGSSSDLVTVNSISADVWPPQKGKDVTLFINADAKSSIADGNYDAAISWSGIVIDDDKGKLSDLGIALPVNAGSVIAKKTFPVPSFAPSGAINIKATATDANNNALFCVNIDTSI